MNTEMEIRNATKEDAEIIFNILRVCAEWLASSGLMHWKRANFSIQSVLAALEKDEVFLIFNRNLAVGTIAISKVPPSWYEFDPSVFWKEKAPAFYLKKLAVLPSYHSKGFASELLKFVENKAKKEGVKFIRFDAVIKNHALTEFYLKRGFSIMGEAVTKNGNPSNFFEKKLSA
ncbi:MAG: GNAT family N-acetyltransferase [Candidatus Micrarchaeota archaeon]|nr:GNAT family N-acetyltransferase [Candidatus Micrarchaeota archaeon]